MTRVIVSSMALAVAAICFQEVVITKIMSAAAAAYFRYSLGFMTCVDIKILRRVRAGSSRRPPRHRRDACSMAWRCRCLAARRSQDGRVIAEE
jgi:hypothetical protein